MEKEKLLDEVEASELSVRMLLKDTLVDTRKIVKRQNIVIILLALANIIMIGLTVYLKVI